MATNPKSFLRRFWLPILLVSAAVISLGIYLLVDNLGPSAGPGTVIPVVENGQGGDGTALTGAGEGTGTTGIRLSEGSEQLQTPVPPPLATGAPLSETDLAAILARLPGLTPEADDRTAFRLPEDVVPPPRTGETIAETFPPPPPAVGPVAVEPGPLEVLRYSPEGEIPIAPFVNITFNQPMVPIATLEDLTEADVPVQVEPDLPGTWRWLGTKTLNFQYDSALIDRMPMATEYHVTIPAGTRSATGGELAESVEFSFRTPPVTLTNYAPSNGPQPLDPVFFAAFNQRIDPQAVLDTIEVKAGSGTVEVRLATEEEIQADPTVKSLAAHALEGRWLAFTAKRKLPTDTTVTITIGPGTPSAEGPLLTESAQSFSFYTYAPLRIEDHGCSWGDDECQPLTPLYIEFNNPIALDLFQEGMLRIEPELPGASVSIYGDTISIRGATAGRTTYRVTVSSEIQDVFGQTLGNNESLRFKIGPAEPVLIGPQQIFVTVDPSSKKPSLSLYAMNYKNFDLKIYAVEPSDWPDFMSYLREFQRTDNPPSPPGQLVLDRVQRLDLADDTLSEVPIDLSEYTPDGSGQFIVIARPPRGLFEQERYWETIQVWVQVTQIGLDAFVDPSSMVVWANALQDGSPLAGVTITTGPGGGTHATDAAGIAKFAIPAGGVSYLVASKGSDQALLPASQYYWGEDGWTRRSLSDELRWFVFDDRGMYRPGEEVHIKGWLRRIGAGQQGDVGPVGNTVTDVSYSIIGPQGNELGNGQAEVNALGGFDTVFTLPENANLGYAQVQFYARGSLSGLSSSTYYHSFQIQEFRRPEFEVNARNETTGPYFAGGYAVVAVQARYYAGDPLPNAEVNWTVTSTPSSYQPPNWPDFTFGTWTPWWWFEESTFGPGGGGATTETYAGATDAAGEHFLRMDFDESQGSRPLSVVAEGTVFDVNRQAWTGTTTLLVHPASLYVGMRSDRYFVSAGDPLEIDLIVTDLDGNAIADRPIMVQAARMEWKYQDGDWRQVEADPQECTIGSQPEPVRCNFETTIGGQYRITATITDSEGRTNQSQITRWVSGGQQPPARTIEQETLTLIPDKESYQPGDVAQILVQSPYTPAEGLLTIARSGILSTERFRIEEGSTTLEIPIEAAYIPNLQIQVDLVGEAPRTDDQGQVMENVPPRSAYARGTLTLNIPPLQRTLELELDPQATELEPGGETTLDLRLIDATGEPVSNAELAVVVVDEAILALTNYQMVDPLTVFYQQRQAELDSRYSRSSILLVDPMSLIESGIAAGQVFNDSKAMGGRGAVEEGLAMPTMAMAPEAEMAADASGAGAAQQPIRIRSDFNPLATFAPEVRTDATGQASVRVKVPDNLTRYRVMVVAVDSSGRQFGSAETNITARLPLMVRPSAPRFLNFGDSFELPVVLQNQTDLPLTVDVALEVSNLKLTGARGMRVEVPAHDRVEVRFPTATDRAGTARFQIAAVSGRYADAAQGELPVYTPATTEAFATYGVIDSGAIAQPVQAPIDVFPQYGGLEITTSSTALQSLTDAVLYLVSYPYECSEQLASRILGVAALRDVLTAFEADGLPAPEEIEAAVLRDIERLSGLQNYDGGFPTWRRGQDSIPFNTIHVAHALQRAELKGFDVPEAMQQNVLVYLRDIESHYPYWYSEYTRRFLSSYALYVRNLMGDRDAAKARSLFHDAEIDQHSLDGLGWLWQVMLDDSGSI
ncbi:MAG: alpha-2-macroglobulin family protein, partial [Anaerolineales bacterium]